MGKIHVLDTVVAELIAAGEVVERPASIVKELIENSIDAGATQIEIEIKGGGIGYIRITDNGSGINVEDLPNAFLRHATSKIYSAEDLDSIGTLGFRGEALASVAAVAKVEVTTKTEDSKDAWFYEIQGGAALEVPMPIGAPNGTTFVIRDVFYNTPARMKFLRSDIAEGNAVAQVVDKAALSNPDVSFTFIRDTKPRLRTSGNGDLQAVIAAVYDRAFASEMISVDYTLDNRVKVYGYVGKPNNSKPTRTYQNFFINDRYVRTRTCSVAVEEAFKGKLMTGRFPVCVLFVEIDPAQVDANVHPAKIEVRFSEERIIYNATYFAVKNALSTLEKVIGKPSEESVKVSTFTDDEVEPKEELPQETLKSTEYIPVYPSSDIKTPLSFESSGKKKFGSFNKGDQTTEPINQGVSLPESFFKTNQVEDFSQPNSGVNEVTTPDFEPLKLVGEYINTYIILENANEELILVDKHAAHERLIYEEVKENSLAGNRQVLLEPIPVTLQRDEYAVLLQNTDELEKLGFLLEDFGTGTLIVRETAVILDGEDVSFLLSEIASKMLSSRRDLTPEVLNQLYYSIACKSALRAGDRSSKAELIEIIRRLEQNPEITHCPHGRPVSITITKAEIEKMFGRIV